MAEDWFSSNAPTVASEPNWFAANAQQPQPDEESSANTRTNTGLTLMAAGKAAPVALRATSTALEHVATSPLLPKVGSVAGRVAAWGVPYVSGDVGAGIGKAVVDLAQNKAVAPLANAVAKVAPYAQTLSTLGGAAGIGDLAQLAEPDRKDIGFLGLGASVPDLEILQKAVAKGANPASAAAAITHGHPQRFGALMTAYLKSRQAR